VYLQSSSESEEECNNTSNDAKDDTGNGGNHESHPGDLHVENNDHGNALDGTALDRNALDGNGGSSDIISASKRPPSPVHLPLGSSRSTAKKLRQKELNPLENATRARIAATSDNDDELSGNGAAANNTEMAPTESGTSNGAVGGTEGDFDRKEFAPGPDHNAGISMEGGTFDAADNAGPDDMPTDEAETVVQPAGSGNEDFSFEADTFDEHDHDGDDKVDEAASPGTLAGANTTPMSASKEPEIHGMVHSTTKASGTSTEEMGPTPMPVRNASAWDPSAAGSEQFASGPQIPMPLPPPALPPPRQAPRHHRGSSASQAPARAPPQQQPQEQPQAEATQRRDLSMEARAEAAAKEDAPAADPAARFPATVAAAAAFISAAPLVASAAPFAPAHVAAEVTFSAEADSSTTASRVLAPAPTAATSSLPPAPSPSSATLPSATLPGGKLPAGGSFKFNPARDAARRAREAALAEARLEAERREWAKLSQDNHHHQPAPLHQSCMSSSPATTAPSSNRTSDFTGTAAAFSTGHASSSSSSSDSRRGSRGSRDNSGGSVSRDNRKTSDYQRSSSSHLGSSEAFTQHPRKHASNAATESGAATTHHHPPKHHKTNQQQSPSPLSVDILPSSPVKTVLPPAHGAGGGAADLNRRHQLHPQLDDGSFLAPAAPSTMTAEATTRDEAPTHAPLAATKAVHSDNLFTNFDYRPPSRAKHEGLPPPPPTAEAADTKSPKRAKIDVAALMAVLATQTPANAARQTSPGTARAPSQASLLAAASKHSPPPTAVPKQSLPPAPNPEGPKTPGPRLVPHWTGVWAEEPAAPCNTASSGSDVAPSASKSQHQDQGEQPGGPVLSPSEAMARLLAEAQAHAAATGTPLQVDGRGRIILDAD